MAGAVMRTQHLGDMGAAADLGSGGTGSGLGNLPKTVMSKPHPRWGEDGLS